jgi:hypothetical protein
MIDKRRDPERYELIKQALDVIFRQLLIDGDNFMQGQVFADGEFYEVTIKIRKVVEGEEN